MGSNMNWTAIFEKLLDPYDVKARLFPGLLVLLPVITYFSLLHGPQNPAVVGLVAVIGACGGPYLLASFIRTWGLRAQARLIRKWGVQPSTVMLRHRDMTLPQQTKLRYHKLATSRLSIKLPSSDEELRDPIGADMAYAAVADALRPLTNNRKDFPFVFKELVAYGFNRNAYGARWIGIAVAIATIFSTLIQAQTFRVEDASWDLSGLGSAQIMVIMFALGMVGLWGMHFTGETVRMAGFSYAKRLWEALEIVQRRSSTAQKHMGQL